MLRRSNAQLYCNHIDNALRKQDSIVALVVSSTPQRVD